LSLCFIRGVFHMTILKQLQGKNQLPNEFQPNVDDIHTTMVPV
jgi:hypothetical protein